MDEQRNGIKPNVASVSQPKTYTPQEYVKHDQMEPFNPQKLVAGVKTDVTRGDASSALIAPELNRRKESLESLPLDLMAYVGKLEKKDQSAALLRVDRLLYQIKVGAYLGQNYGKIIKITESELVIREIVQDAAGEWIERMATLRLQEEIKQ
jgi:type IV pilus assembly protein PilP